jgi:hypothetical protein
VAAQRDDASRTPRSYKGFAVTTFLPPRLSPNRKLARSGALWKYERSIALRELVREARRPPAHNPGSGSGSPLNNAISVLGSWLPRPDNKWGIRDYAATNQAVVKAAPIVTTRVISASAALPRVSRVDTATLSSAATNPAAAGAITLVISVAFAAANSEMQRGRLLHDYLLKDVDPDGGRAAMRGVPQGDGAVPMVGVEDALAFEGRSRRFMLAERPTQTSLARVRDQGGSSPRLRRRSSLLCAEDAPRV